MKQHCLPLLKTFAKSTPFPKNQKRESRGKKGKKK
jgi:hypothetical protein